MPRFIGKPILMLYIGIKLGQLLYLRDILPTSSWTQLTMSYIIIHLDINKNYNLDLLQSMIIYIYISDKFFIH